MNTTSAALIIGAYLGLTLLLPICKHRLVQGEWPLTFHRDADPFQRLVGGLMAVMFTGGLAWAVTLAVAQDAVRLWAAPGWVAWLGVALLGLGALLEVGGQLTMGASFRVGIDDRPTALVQGGLFRTVRNPVFSGLLLALLGVVLLTPSGWTVMGYLWIASLIAIQVRLEEQHLLRLHGDAYLHYAARTGRFVPGIGTLAVAKGG